jgi:hypothetical protein
MEIEQIISCATLTNLYKLRIRVLVLSSQLESAPVPVRGGRITPGPPTWICEVTNPPSCDRGLTLRFMSQEEAQQECIRR